MSFTDGHGTQVGRGSMWLEFGPGGARGRSFLNEFWHHFRYCENARLTHGGGASQLLGSTPDEEALDNRFFHAVGSTTRWVRSHDSLELRSKDGFVVIRLDSDASTVEPSPRANGSQNSDDDNPTSSSLPYPPPPCP